MRSTTSKFHSDTICVHLRSSAFICGFIIVAAERRRENASGDPPTLYAGRNRRKKLNHDGTKHTKNESAIKPSS